jgi:acetate kinase
MSATERRVAGEIGMPDILCLNVGSSSLKYALYRMGEDREELLTSDAMRANATNGSPEPRTAVEQVFADLAKYGFSAPAAVGHRLVHGGPAYGAPRRIDAEVLATLRRLIPLAPLHLPGELEVIEAVSDHYPELPQVACFDTAFHRSLPELTQRFPLPRELWSEELRRYGFHGISYEYIAGVLGPTALTKTIIAHLGNGASLVAIRDGRPIDTTMGLTPIGGVVMGTRSGDLDPGVLLYLMRERGYDAHRLERLLNKEAGLLGISATTSDMKSLLARRAHDPRAAEAVEMFCVSVRKHIGALAAVLGGVQTLVFTGGIGERAAAVRWEICQGLEPLGIRLDPPRNASHAETISAPHTGCRVRVIPTNEDLMIARHTRAVLRAPPGA